MEVTWLSFIVVLLTSKERNKKTVWRCAKPWASFLNLAFNPVFWSSEAGIASILRCQNVSARCLATDTTSETPQRFSASYPEPGDKPLKGLKSIKYLTEKFCSISQRTPGQLRDNRKKTRITESAQGQNCKLSVYFLTGAVFIHSWLLMVQIRRRFENVHELIKSQEELLTLGEVWAVWNVKQNYPEFCLPGVYNPPGN